MVDLVKSLAELGITAVVVGLAFYVFLKIYTKDKEQSSTQINKLMEDAHEDRKENRKVQSEVANAISDLASAHRLQERAVREAISALGERPKQHEQATSEGQNGSRGND